MRAILKYLLINRQFTFSGKKSDLIGAINKVKGISVKEINIDKLKIYPWISIGTLVAKSGHSWVDGINIKAELMESDSSLIKLRLLTTMRPEHYFIAGIFILFFVFIPLDKGMTYKLISDWLIAHILFQLVCRIQEELLIKLLTKGLKLSKM